jgi:hypothetical protein
MSQDLAIFERQLEYIKPQLYNVEFPKLQFANGTLIPIDESVPSSAETITYKTYTRHGLAKIISDYATDFANADVSGKETTSVIKSVGSAFTYSIQEIRAAQSTGMNLPSKKFEAAVEAVNQKMDQIALDGEVKAGLNGLLSHPNIGEYTVPANGTGSSQKWADKTAEQILDDMFNICEQSAIVSKNVEQVDTLLLPSINYKLIARRRASSTAPSDTTILKFFKEVMPEVTVISVPKFNGKGENGSGVMVAYERNPKKLTFEIPQDIETFPAQQEMLAYKVPVHARTGGVIIYYPLSITKAEGI